jgi:hypothetical protein
MGGERKREAFPVPHAGNGRKDRQARQKETFKGLKGSIKNLGREGTNIESFDTE